MNTKEKNKELTYGKILFRVFTYLVSLIVIECFIFLAFISTRDSTFIVRRYFLGTLLVFIAVALYLISDILILVKNSNRKNKNAESIFWFSIIFILIGAFGVIILIYIKDHFYLIGDYLFNSIVTFFEWELIVSFVIVIISFLFKLEYKEPKEGNEIEDIDKNTMSVNIDEEPPCSSESMIQL